MPYFGVRVPYFGVRMPLFCRNPLILRGFYAIGTYILWAWFWGHIWGWGWSELFSPILRATISPRKICSHIFLMQLHLPCSVVVFFFFFSLSLYLSLRFSIQMQRSNLGITSYLGVQSAAKKNVFFSWVFAPPNRLKAPKIA